MHYYDCAVVGAGVEGSATGYHLTKNGCRTVLIEQFRLGHARGSSHGESRIIRYAYRQKHYADMMVECFRTWEQLEQELGTKLYRNVGLLCMDGPPYEDFWPRVETLEATGKPYDLLTAQEVCKRFPGFSLEPEMKAFIDPNGGVLRSDRCLHALQTLFVKQGGVVKENEKVLEIIPGETVTIVTNRGQYTAKSVVLTPGAWASTMLRPLGIDPPLKVVRVSVCYWPEAKPGIISNYPCFYFLSQKYETFGIPSEEYPGLMKVCFHDGKLLQDPEEERQGEHKRDLLQSFLREHVPGLRAEPALIDNCLFTNSPDEDFVIDRHPDHPNIIIGCGFSGHGFKLAPAVGRILMVGAGVEGSSTGYHLTKNGCRTVLIEQFQLGHARGSSHGESRITRYAYRQKHYADMMVECFRTWEQLEREIGTKLYRNVGLLSVDGPPYEDFWPRIETLKATGKPYELLTAQEVCKRFPGFSLEPEMKAFIDPNGGVLRSDRCLHALQTLFVKQGGVVKENEKVLEVIPGETVTIVTNRGQYTAKSVVLTLGAWASKMLRPLGIDPPLKVERLDVCHWPEAKRGTISNYPCFYFLSQKYETCGMPSEEHPGLMKVCFIDGELLQDPEEEEQGENKRNLMLSFLREHVPGLRAEPALIENCLVTNSPDEDFVIDRHPDHPNVIIGCGFSGHGFKLAPAVGRILSELATGVTPSYDISPLSLKRFPNNGRIRRSDDDL